MITPSYGLTATERVLPSMALDFTTATLDPRVTFTRTGNTATVINSSGLVAPINADLPRFDFNPITLACNGLLIEEQRTNLLLYSEQIDNAAWTKARSSITANDTVSPDGTLDGDKLVEDTTATNSHFIEQSAAIVSGTTYSYSVFAKQAERSQIRVRSFMTASASADFNLSNGTVSNASGTVSQSITSIGNGWYKCTIVASSSTTGTGFFSVFLMSGGSVTYTGNGVSGAYIWGAQLEVGAFQTSYIPTVASQVTRTADVATMTGTNFSSWYVVGGGALTVEAAMVGGVPSSSARIVSFGGVNVDTDDISLYWGTSQGYPLGSVRASNSQQYAGGPAVTIASQATFKAALRYATNIGQAATNGSIAAVDNSVILPTVVSMGFGQPAVFQSTANVWIKKVAYYPQTLTANETQAFSK